MLMAHSRVAPNTPINTDGMKRRSFVAPPHAAGYGQRLIWLTRVKWRRASLLFPAKHVCF